jgi:hypothetical protein
MRKKRQVRLVSELSGKRARHRSMRPALLFMVLFALCAMIAGTSDALFSNRIPSFGKAQAQARGSAAIESARDPGSGAGKGQLQGLSQSAAQQVQALIAEKESRTPAQQKIDSQLIYAAKMHRGESIAAGIQTLEVEVGADAAGMLTVDISASIDDQLLASLRRMGITYSNVFPQYHALRAVASLDQLEAIASLSQVRFIQPKQEARTNQRAGAVDGESNARASGSFPSAQKRLEQVRRALAQAGVQTEPGATTNILPNGYAPVGAANAEGVITHRAYSARGTFNTDGTGIRIGFLSDSAKPASVATSQASGDLPPTCSSLLPLKTEHCVNVVPGQDGAAVSGALDEGIAMMEVVHDLAPGAQLYFATAFTGITAFAQNIGDLRNIYSCDIIVDDVGYFVESPFQDGQGPLVISPTNGGIVTQAVNDAVASGALYFSSAANSGNKNDNTSGTWEGDFNDGGASGAPLPAGNVHNFGGQNFDTLTVSGGGAPINLIWSDPLGGSSNDYDLFRLNAAGTTIIASSTNIQSGTQDPIEQISQSTANPRIVILKKVGAAGRFLHLDTNRGQLSISTQGNTHGHNAASGAYGVAATPAYSPFSFPVGPTSFFGPFANPFSGTNVIETFSSDGPRRVFFNGDGTAITPGDFSSTGGLVLQQPLITAADGEEVTGVGGFPNPFFGTSCAAPSGAAIAALLKSANGALTQAQIKTALTSSAIDIETPGTDRDAGAGIVMAYPALQAAGVTGKAYLEPTAFVAAELCCNGNGLIEPNEVASLGITLNNTGLLSATGITTTLTTSTPNVSILQGSSNYSNLAAGSSGSNTTQYQFSLGTAVPVDQIVSFTLTINYAGGWNPSQVINFTLQTGRQPITTALDTTAPAASISFPNNSTSTQTARLFRANPASSCAVPKAFPGTSGSGSRRFDSYTLTNPTGSAVCVTATIQPDKASTDFLILAAYSGNYNPASLGTNYLADIGTSPSLGYTKPMSFTVPGSGTVVVVVDEVTALGTGTNTPYTLQVSGLPVTAPSATCTIICPANITQSNDLNQCGAVVNYPAPAAAPACGTVTCSPASGSFFPKGTTTVTCLSNGGAGPESCSFTVTVNDTQAPHVGTCPADIVKQVDPGQQTAVATFETPGASDNCPGVTIACSPASGAAFPIGTTTVTCTATDGSSNTSSCNFTVTVLTPRPWTSAGSTGTIDEDSLSKIAVQNFTARFVNGQIGTGTIRYNITATRGISTYCPATQSVVNVRFRNSDNTGTHAQVKFEIHRSNIVTGGNDVIFSFNSNGLGAGNAFTTASIAPNIDFDFGNYVYWIEGTVFRDDAGQSADLGSIEIYESAGTLCP